MPTDPLRGFQDLKRSDPFINNNLTIRPTSHSHHLHRWCPRSLPLAKVKDSVVTSLQSTISHQVSQKTPMEVNFNNPIYNIGPSLPQERMSRIQSLVLTQFITIALKFIFMEKESAFFNNISARHFLTIIKVTTIHQAWFFQITFKVIISAGQILSSQP